MGMQSTTISVWSAATPHVEKTSDNVLRQLNTQAQQAYASRRFDVAEARYKEALKLATSRPLVEIVLWTNLGAVFREQHKYDEADSAFKQALQIAGKNNLLNKPASQTAMRQYAVLLRKMHHTEEAEAWDMRAAAAAAAEAGAGIADASSTDGRSNSMADSAANGMIKSSIVPSSASGSKSVEYDKLSIDDAHEMVNKYPDRPEPLLLLTQKYSDKSDWPKAIGTLNTAFERFPDESKKRQALMASLLFKNGQYQEAASAINKAIEIDPNKGLYYLMLHDFETASGNQQAALDAWKTFLDKFPGDPEYEKISQAYQYSQQDMKDRADQRMLGNKPLPIEQKYSWPLKMFPLKVFIHNRYDDNFKLRPTENQMSEDTPAAVIQKACDMWTVSSQNRVSFMMTDRPEEAQIEVFFTDSSDGLEQSFAQGITEHPQLGESKARVRLLAITPSSGQPLDRGAFLDTVLHEFGHALGLEHSDDVRDIMFPTLHQRPLCSLSQNDARRMQILYGR